VCGPIDRIAQAPLFLEIVKMLVDPGTFAKWGVKQAGGASVADYLVARDLHGLIRSLVLVIVRGDRLRGNNSHRYNAE